jgi:hypothetical protein
MRPKLLYQGFFKDAPEGAIYLLQVNGCKLIANIVPAACTTQLELDEDMSLIVACLNQCKIGAQLENKSHHTPK